MIKKCVLYNIISRTQYTGSEIYNGPALEIPVTYRTFANAFYQHINAHANVSSGAKCLNFGVSPHLHPHLIYMNRALLAFLKLVLVRMTDWRVNRLSD